MSVIKAGLTSGLIMTAGDICAQLLERLGGGQDQRDKGIKLMRTLVFTVCYQSSSGPLLIHRSWPTALTC